MALVNKSIAECWIGVDLFFIISGYVISQNLVPKLDATQKSLDRLSVIRSFYIRRFWRIIPTAVFWALFALGMALVVASLGFAEHRQGEVNVVFRHFLAVLFFAENFYFSHEPSATLSQYWSLAVEEQFYLAFPLFLILFRGRFRALFFVTSVLCIAPLYRPHRMDHLLTLLRFDAIMIGVLLYLWRRQLADALNPWLSNANRLKVLSATLSLLILACVVPTQAGDMRGSLFLVDICCAGLVVFAVVDRDIFRRTVPKCCYRSIHWIGMRSYSLYLAHKPAYFLLATILLVLERRGVPIGQDLSIYTVVAGVGLALIFTELSYRMIERPTQAFGQRVSSEHAFTESRMDAQLQPTSSSKSIS